MRLLRLFAPCIDTVNAIFIVASEAAFPRFSYICERLIFLPVQLAAILGKRWGKNFRFASRHRKFFLRDAQRKDFDTSFVCVEGAT